MVTILTSKPTIANHFIAELRDINIQKDRMRFRRNLERVGELLAFEISKTLEYTPVTVTTPLAQDHTSLIASQPVLLTILRAGLPLHEGLLNYFDRADSGFASAYRTHNKETGDIEIITEYLGTPDLTGKVVIISDPMLATGLSMVAVCNELNRRFNIKEMHIVSAFGSKDGLEYVQKQLPNAKIWLGVLDPELTPKSYIVPGLGDAGDLCFGPKL